MLNEMIEYINNNMVNWKILLPRFDTLGDIVLLKGFIDVLLTKFPKADVTLFVREGYDQLKPLFSDRLVWRTQPFNPWSRYSNDELKSIDDALRVVACEPWDMVLFTTYNRTFLEDIFAAMLIDPLCITLGREVCLNSWQQRAFVRLGLTADNIYDQIIPVAEHSHETEKYQLLWNQVFDAKEGIPIPCIDVPKTIKSEGEKLLQEFCTDSRAYVACMPAGLQNITIKKWPEDRYAKVLVWLSAELGIVPLLIGHEREREVLEKVKKDVEAEGVKVSLWLGKQGDLGIMGALLQKAELYLGNDSAPMHLAAAVGTPVVGIMGGGHWPRFIPTGARSLAVTSFLPCYYCEWQCIFGNAPCVKLVTVDDVKDAVIRILNGNSNVGSVYHATTSLRLDTENMIAEVFKKCKELKDELTQRQEVIDALAYSLEEKEIENEYARSVVNSMHLSLTWRLTAPLRKIVDAIRKL